MRRLHAVLSESVRAARYVCSTHAGPALLADRVAQCHALLTPLVDTLGRHVMAVDKGQIIVIGTRNPDYIH